MIAVIRYLNAVLAAAGVSDGVARVAYVIAGYCNAGGYAWPGIERIAADVGRSPDTVARRIQKLEQLGVLAVDRRRGAVNVYRFPVSDPARLVHRYPQHGAGGRRPQVPAKRAEVPASMSAGGVPALWVRVEADEVEAAPAASAAEQCGPPTTEYLEAVAELRRRMLGESEAAGQ